MVTYGDLKTDIVSRANRDDLSEAEIELAVKLAQMYLYRRMRLPAMEKSGQWQILNSNQIILPEDYLELISLSILGVNGAHSPIQLTGYESAYHKERTYEHYVPSDSYGEQVEYEAYRRAGSIYIVPETDAPHAFATYYAYPPFLRDDEDRNWFTDNAYDALFNRGVAEVFRTAEDAVMASHYDKLSQQAVSDIQMQADREAMGGTVLKSTSTSRWAGT